MRGRCQLSLHTVPVAVRVAQGEGSVSLPRGRGSAVGLVNLDYSPILIGSFMPSNDTVPISSIG